MSHVIVAILMAVALTIECFLDPIRPFFLIWDTAFLTISLFMVKKKLDGK